MTDRFQAFAALHVPGAPLILFNAWDAGSARAVAKAGARAIATGSASVAMANGMVDGEALPMAAALANADRIVAAVDLPVTIDFEGGYAVAPEAVAGNMTALARDRCGRLQFRGPVGWRRRAVPGCRSGGAHRCCARSGRRCLLSQRPHGHFFEGAGRRA